MYKSVLVNPAIKLFQLWYNEPYQSISFALSFHTICLSPRYRAPFPSLRAVSFLSLSFLLFSFFPSFSFHSIYFLFSTSVAARPPFFFFFLFDYLFIFALCCSLKPLMPFKYRVSPFYPSFYITMWLLMATTIKILFAVAWSKNTHSVINVFNYILSFLENKYMTF